MKRTLFAVAAVALVALAAALILTRPDPGHDMFTAYRDLYPGTPASAEAAFVAKADQLCDAGMPLTWWETWPQSPSNRDLWNLTIAHMCPEYAGHVVSVAP